MVSGSYAARIIVADKSMALTPQLTLRGHFREGSKVAQDSLKPPRPLIAGVPLGPRRAKGFPNMAHRNVFLSVSLKDMQLEANPARDRSLGVEHGATRQAAVLMMRLSARSRNGVHISDQRLTALIHMHMLDADGLRAAVAQAT